MKTKVILRSRDNLYYAEGVYVDGKLTVNKGSKIRLGETYKKCVDLVIEYRNDRTKVDSHGNVLENIEFRSPSTAAQFVTGSSTNGYIRWRTENMNLKSFIEKIKGKEGK